MGRAEPGDPHPIINKWGRTWGVPSQVRVVWSVLEPDMGNLHIHMHPELSLLLTCLSSFQKHLTSALTNGRGKERVLPFLICPKSFFFFLPKNIF
jgi:hypothetical protein